MHVEMQKDGVTYYISMPSYIKKNKQATLSTSPYERYCFKSIYGAKYEADKLQNSKIIGA